MRQSISVNSFHDGGVIINAAIAAETDTVSIGSLFKNDNTFFIIFHREYDTRKGWFCLPEKRLARKTASQPSLINTRLYSVFTYALSFILDCVVDYSFLYANSLNITPIIWIAKGTLYVVE